MTRRAVLLLIFFLLFVLFLTDVIGCGKNHQNYSIWFGKGSTEDVENVRVYVPFPRDGNQPEQELLNELSKGAQAVYNSANEPNVNMNIVNTPYGKMIKIDISKIDDDGVWLNCFYKYPTITLFNLNKAQSKYPLQPLISSESEDKTYIYLEHEGTGLIKFNIKYQAGFALFRPFPTVYGITWESENAVLLSPGWNEVRLEKTEGEIIE